MIFPSLQVPQIPGNPTSEQLGRHRPSRPRDVDCDPGPGATDLWLENYHLVMTNSLLLKMAIYSDLMVISWWFMVIHGDLWWFHGDFMVIHGDLMVIHGDLIVIYGDLMVI